MTSVVRLMPASLVDTSPPVSWPTPVARVQVASVNRGTETAPFDSYQPPM